MKKARRLLSVILLSVLMAGLVAACTDNSNADNTTKTNSGENKAQNNTKNADSESDPGAKPDPAASFSELHIKMLGQAQTGTKLPTEDLLTPIWREKTKVVPELVSIPTGTDGLQWYQTQIVAGTLPEVLTGNGNFDNPQIKDFLKKSKVLRPITLEEMKANMPLLAARAEKYGVSLDEIYKDNVDADGKLWYVPAGFNTMSTPYVRSTEYADRMFNLMPYAVWVRDDILKQVVPSAKTEAELRQLYVERNGQLTYEDVNDIPVKNRDEFFDFLSKIKALNLKEDGKPVIPGSPNANSDVGSLMWSNLTMGGFWWGNFGSWAWKEDKLVYVQNTPEWKDYISWYNKAYNAGLLDKEAFIQKDDQRNAKIINGQYAVFQEWGPVNDARKTAKAKGATYGYRLLTTFPDMPLETEYQSNQYFGVSLNGSWKGVGITTSAKEENIPQLLHWIDWNMSEEADEIRHWGPAGKLYDGEGGNRRFKPEYKELEDWSVRSVNGEKDGTYYGMYKFNNDMQAFNAETYGINSFDYPEQPWIVYPREVKNDVDIDQITRELIRKHYKDQLIFYKGDPHLSPTYFDPDGDFSKLSPKYGWDSEKGKSAIAKAIVGKVEDFDKNYEAYMATYGTEWKEAEKGWSDKWAALWNQYGKPAVEEAKSAK